MTILQALNDYYGRMERRGEAEPIGYSREKISFVVVLSAEGEPVKVTDWRDRSGKRLVPRLEQVPAAVKRTVAILPNLFWDKSAYVLGRTAGEGRRTAEEHAAFKALHLPLLAASDDPGLVAVRRFLEDWTPERFDGPPFRPDMLDANLVFALDGENGFIHDRDAARPLVAARAGGEGANSFCLISGVQASPARLHPTVRGVQGAQSSGAALVSFNLDAFTSYGKEQGDNAPTSQGAAFRYGAALNRMLDRGSRNRLSRQIGDATVVFWADTAGVGEAAAEAAEDTFVYMVEPPAKPETDTDKQAAAEVRDQLDKIAKGRPLKSINPKLEDGTRFHVLGLSPNAARLSVRYWLSDDFQHFVERLAAHHEAVHIQPTPIGWRQPTVNLVLARTTALLGKFDNIPNQLAGEVMRAILSGTPYPRTLLSATIMRLRAGDNPGLGWHAAVIKACLNYNYPKEAIPEGDSTSSSSSESEEKKVRMPVALDPKHPSTAYQLGRLFYVLEQAQYAALGRVNAPIGDRYYAAASSTPARVFGPLLRGLKVHVSDARKRGRGGWIEGRVAEIMAHIPAELPKTLLLEDQGRFAVGYYHERGTRPPKGEAGAADIGVNATDNTEPTAGDDDNG